ncbi:MAG TPA: xanthine dehydrogenase family protein subunit M [Bryobacteraceae bacterium]|nr:xanthine dehydrogenase family protein subunit M [Bryobacteraceae bacterium]HOQ47260.1 xanthine dehydrogenase family protein subunit M [Bryobacteraceae bacterium]HPQ15654.1 xanthine dehydrogenase family protein subunit M [Bryobacteraceae bacterium]HPU74126.1 xanthine dehydrogenase family protein subunit M [Bryobacteraceae bacterium]
MQAFEYARPSTVQEAVSLLGNSWEDANLLAGGTDLLSLMKDYIHTPKRLVSLKGIKELEGIRKSAGGLRIGALVTLEELLRNPDVRKEYPSLAAAARGVASPQMRNMGTVGGDLCQRPRCWYFRLGFGLLAKGPNGESLVPSGDNRYHAIFNNRGPAYFVSASSFGPPLVALGATVNLVSPSGTRELPVEKFFVAPATENARENVLAPNEILTEILVPPAAGVRNATYEVRQKMALDYPLATASVALRMRGNTVASARIVLGHVAPVPWRAQAAEKALTGKTLNAAAIEEAAKAAVQGATPLSMNGYKVQLASVAVKRALEEAAQART